MRLLGLLAVGAALTACREDRKTPAPAPAVAESAAPSGAALTGPAFSLALPPS